MVSEVLRHNESCSEHFRAFWGVQLEIDGRLTSELEIKRERHKCLRFDLHYVAEDYPNPILTIPSKQWSHISSIKFSFTLFPDLSVIELIRMYVCPMIVTNLIDVRESIRDHQNDKFESIG